MLSFGGASALAMADAPLVWLDERGRPRAIAHEAVALLADARSHGLNPEDYAADALARGIAQAAAGSTARLQAALDAALTRFLADLHDGRIDPRTLGQACAAPRREPFDAAASLRRAVAAGRLGDAVREATLPLAQYAQLRSTRGGVGFYPHERFVHLDTGRVRRW
jgi:murein L,D-transpeptidase YcbB/YkuD